VSVQGDFMTIYFIQPAVPEYRVSFFKRLLDVYDVKIYTTEKDFLGVNTTFNSPCLDASPGFYNLFGKIYWHRQLPLLKVFKKGDIVVINGNPRILNYMLLFIILRVLGIKSVWWGQGWTAGSFGYLARLRVSMMKLANSILVYTDKEKSKLHLRSCYSLNNGLDSAFISRFSEPEVFRESLVNGYFNLVFVGRLTEKANLKMLLLALSKVSPRICLNVIGTGDDEAFYKQLAISLGVKNRVLWHGGLFNELKISKIMNRSHAFIYTGAVGLSLIHAYNYSLPAIIHSDEKYHMPEFAAFEESINGFGFRRNDVEDLCRKIEKIASLQLEDYVEMRKAAQITVSKSFNIDDMVNRFNLMIRET